MNTSIARQECATLSFYTTPRTTDTSPMLSFAGCQNEQSMDQPGKVANPARGQLNREN